MIKIDGKEIRTESEQVWKNMEDIDKLQEAIKPEYTTDAVLTDTSVSVVLTDTNAPVGTTKGWLLTHDGLKFKITGGDGTNLLLEFYADLKGPQGEDGAALNIDDSETSLTKVWSSQKTKTYADGLIIKTNPSAAASDSKTYSAYLVDLWHSSGIAWTTILPSDGKMALENIIIGSSQASASSNGDPKIKKGDLIVYVDGDLKASALYSVTNDRDENYDVPVAKVCDFSQGKQLYHNIVGVSNLTWVAGESRSLHVVFDLYLPFKFTDVNSFISWIDNLTEPTPVFAIGQGWSSGWTSIVTMLKPSGQAGRVKFDMASFNHSNLITDVDIVTNSSLSSQQIFIKN